MLLWLIVMACANSLGIQAHNSDVITSTQQPIAEDKIHLKTELVAPISHSLSQYFQPPSLLEIQFLKQQQNQQNRPQTLAQLLNLQAASQQQQQQQQFIHPLVQQQQQASAGQINPFLYLGQLTLSDSPGDINSNQQQQNHLQIKRRSDERNLQKQEKSSYELFRPDEDESVEYVDMLPPPEKQEPNYYVLKPRKLKKYNKADAKEKKKNSRRATENLKKEIKHTNKDNPDLLTESTDDIEQSAPTSRLDFQMHGHKGPKTYKFGYDTGDGKNRQFRIEEKNEKGDVFGSYGYFDRKGKFRVVNYSSTAKDGFKILH